MKRVSNLDRKAVVHRAVTTVEDALDALEWCKLYDGQGRFHFQWLIDSGVNDDRTICGCFKFTDRDDHMMFSLKWVR